MMKPTRSSLPSLRNSDPVAGHKPTNLPWKTLKTLCFAVFGAAMALCLPVAVTGPALAQTANPTAPKGTAEAEAATTASGQTEEAEVPVAVSSTQPAQNAAVVRSPIFTVDRDALFSQSKYGKRILAELEQERARLAREARRVEAALAEEEKQLTEKRDTLPAEEFRKLADAFDAKVQALRQETPAQEQAFSRRFEQERVAFFEKAGPVLGQLVRDLGGIMIIDRRAILLTTQNIDITAVSIARINAELGEGAPDTPARSEPQDPPDAQQN